MSMLHRGVRAGCFVFLVLGIASAASAEGWNPLSIFKKSKPPAYRPVIPASAQLPIKAPQIKLPQMPQMPAALPGLDNQTFQGMKIPSIGGQRGSVAPASFVDKWNQGTEKIRKALTLPKIKMPTFDGAGFTGGQIQNENPFLQPLANKIPFGNAAQSAQPRKSLLPQWISGKPATSQPPTLQNWLNQPRPQ